MAIKIILLLLFFAATVFIGFFFSKRATSVNEFVLAGRSVGPWLTAFSYGTTYFSAVVFVGYAGQFGWRFGTSAVWIGLGNAFIGSLLPWVILGRRTRIMTNHLKSATMPEFFGTRFTSDALKIGASIIVFIFLIPYTASLYNGLSRLFSMAFRINFIYCIIGMAVLTCVYVVAGGYLATAVNNFIQGIIMIVGIVAVVASVLGDNGGFMGALRGMALVNVDEAAATPGVFASFFGPDPLNLLGVVLLTSLGTWGLPQMVARFYSIKSENAISKGTLISTAFALVIAGGSYFLGSFGRLYSGVVERGPTGAVVFDSIIPKILEGFPDILVGLIVLLVLSASMSTLSSLVMTSSSTLTLDFIKGHIIKKMDDKRQLFIIRLLIVVFIIISTVIATIQYSGGITFIAQLMGVSWGALAGSFLAPFLFGLYWKRVSKASIWCNFIFSTALMTLNIFFRGSFPAILQSPINAGAFTMLAGFIIVPAVSMFTKAPAKESVDACFSCYDQMVSIKIREALGSNDSVE
ncbi:MAG: sodium:solute symporter [Oscillospiraceae bacterium]|nr:sodium:solute symporter [Oscillospiraceae bacterium]